MQRVKMERVDSPLNDGKKRAPASGPGSETEAAKIAQAVAEGYPDVDEVCSECKTVFKNYHHFIRCDRRPCPMADGKGTLFEQWAALEAASGTEGGSN